MWPLNGTAEGWELICFCGLTIAWQEGIWTVCICVFICCFLSPVHNTKVKEKRLTEKRDGEEGKPVKSLLVFPQLQLQCWSSVWHLRPFTLLFLLHFMPISLASVLPVLRSSCWAEAFEGPGHPKVELATRRVYNTGKLSQPVRLVASWETGKETSKVEKIDLKKKTNTSNSAVSLQLRFFSHSVFRRATMKWMLSLSEVLWTSSTYLPWLPSKLLIINNRRTNSSVFHSFICCLLVGGFLCGFGFF